MHNNSKWDVCTHNFGNFSTFTKLLDRICVLHIVHRDSIDHNNSVIFPRKVRQR